jgi:cytochrome c
MRNERLRDATTRCKDWADIGSLNRRTKMPLKVIVSGLLVVAGLMTAPLAVGAADRSTPEQAKALAEKAATYLKDKGPDAALPAFNDRNGSFVHGDLYVFVFDMTGKYLASGANPTLTGTNAKDLKDAEGKPVVQDMIAKAKENGSGQVDYLWLRVLRAEWQPI